ncbi:MAG: hypothetical protein KF883_00245 [Thermomicrobiales bacterium]|nr:hypothetical protein [Thermomicrobiales bacterium]
MTSTFGNVPHPPFVDRLIPDTHNRAWDDLGQRKPIGVCQHSMLGSLWGTDAYFRRGAASRALTDYGIGGSTDGGQGDGVILRWNDPLGRGTAVDIDGVSHRVSANRAPWANGGSDDLEGDGPAFVRKLGIAAINRDLVSIERSDGGIESTPMSPKQFESICALTAHWFDHARVPWEQFPFNPGAGVTTHMLHYEFASKTCPFAPVTNRIAELQNRIRQILKAGQTLGQPAPATTPAPLAPSPVQPADDWWPQGYAIDALAARFGVLMKKEADGTERPARFDPKGVISNAWVARGVAEQRTVAQLPIALRWWVLHSNEDQRCDLVTFDDRWTLFRPDQHVAWTWIA